MLGKKWAQEKTRAREGDTQGERERLHGRLPKIVSSRTLSPLACLPRARLYFLAAATQATHEKTRQLFMDHSLPRSWGRKWNLSSMAIGCLETHNALDVTTPDDVKADANACGINARFARDDIINLAARRFARNEYYASSILGQNHAAFYPAQQALTGDSYSPQGFPRQHEFRV